MPEEQPFRSGFVALLGRPNVGKSTLFNRILGEKIAIVSPKPQTTRNRIRGIRNETRAQIVFVDTPGLHDARRKDLNRAMVENAREAAVDADVLALLISAKEGFREDDEIGLDLLRGREQPAVLVINKVDQIPRPEVLPVIEKAAGMNLFKEIVPLSALKGDNVAALVEVCKGLLPEGPALFPDDILTDQAERVWAAEIVREKIFRNTAEELPYASTVVVETFEEDKDLIRIRALVMVERDSQKGIVIGRGGSMLKKIGSEARRDLEKFLGVKVYLELFVRVQKEWWRDPANWNQ